MDSKIEGIPRPDEHFPPNFSADVVLLPSALLLEEVLSFQCEWYHADLVCHCF